MGLYNNICELEYKELNLNQFIWTCAKTFHHLEEISDQLIEHYKKNIEITKKEIAIMEQMTPSEIENKVCAIRSDCRDYNKKVEKIHAKTAEKYNSMLEKISNWNASAKQESLKQAIIATLEYRICAHKNELYLHKEPTNPGDWHKEQLEYLYFDLARYEKYYNEAIETKSKNQKNIEDLRNSIGPEQ